MMPTLRELGLDRLTAEERIAVAEALWETIGDERMRPLSPTLNGVNWIDGWPTAWRTPPM